MNPSTGNTSSVTKARAHAYDETLRELELLGVVFGYEPNPLNLAQVSKHLTSGISGIQKLNTPYSIKLLALHDPEMLHRTMTAIRNTDKSLRSVWTETLGGMITNDPTKRGTAKAVIELNRLRPAYERLLAVNPLNIALLGTGQKDAELRTFWNLTRSVHIENHTGIAPGDDGYSLVLANLIHVNLARHDKYGQEEVQPYLAANRNVITYIAEHIDETLKALPELYKRKATSRDAIETILDINPVLAEGAL